VAANKTDLIRLSWFEESTDKDLETPDRRKLLIRPKDFFMKHRLIWLLRGVRTELGISDYSADRE
jgi:hypothetical protein